VAASLQLDSDSGQIHSILADLPQLPLRALRLDFNPESRAPLRAPFACGAYTVRAEAVPWSAQPPLFLAPQLSIDQGCAAPGFDPDFTAGATDPAAAAGGASPFLVTLTRNAGEAEFSGLELKLPAGISADLASVPTCPGQLATTGACPQSSRVGSLIVALGAGSRPLWLPTPGGGPRRGLPRRLLPRRPLQPDLCRRRPGEPARPGTVLTRAANHFDLESARASIRPDPLPQIVAGIPRLLPQSICSSTVPASSATRPTAPPSESKPLPPPPAARRPRSASPSPPSTAPRCPSGRSSLRVSVAPSAATPTRPCPSTSAHVPATPTCAPPR
jgi:hypothetical protein